MKASKLIKEFMINQGIQRGDWIDIKDYDDPRKLSKDVEIAWPKVKYDGHPIVDGQNSYMNQLVRFVNNKIMIDIPERREEVWYGMSPDEQYKWLEDNGFDDEDEEENLDNYIYFESGDMVTEVYTGYLIGADRFVSGFDGDPLLGEDNSHYYCTVRFRNGKVHVLEGQNRQEGPFYPSGLNEVRSFYRGIVDIHFNG